MAAGVSQSNPLDKEARKYCEKFIMEFAACMKVEGFLGPFKCRKELNIANDCFREYNLLFKTCQSVFSAPFQDDFFCESTLFSETTDCCRITVANQINRKIRRSLHELLKTSYFRYYKINLSRPCPFWKDEMVCTSEGCSVATLNKDPNGWESQLSDIQFPTFQIGGSLFSAWDFDEDEFCLLDRENDSKGVYVDLQENPERFTGYTGPSSQRIWQSIYEENCFNGKDHKNSISGIVWKRCVERQLFYRVISGMHASISIHLADQFYDHVKKAWIRNLAAYMERVGNHPDRVKNVYLLFKLLYRAVCRLALDVKTFHPATLDPSESSFIMVNLRDIASQAIECPTTLDKILFSSSKPEIIEEFKEHFRNVTRIMDCVSCERCRLWGKIQTTGIGTALKVLSSPPGELKLRRVEIICLVNALGRLSDSLSSIEGFSKQSANSMFDKVTKMLNLTFHPISLLAIALATIATITWIVAPPPKLKVQR